MTVGEQQYTLTFGTPTGGAAKQASNIVASDLSGCTGVVSIASGLITTGPGIGKHQAQRGLIDTTIYDETLKFEIDGSGAGGQGPWRCGIRGIADCGTGGGTGTRISTSVDGNLNCTVLVQVNSQTAIVQTLAPGTMTTRSRWTIQHISTGTERVIISYQTWNGASFDAPVVLLTANRGTQVWSKTLLDAMNVYCGQEDFETGVPGTVTFRINNF